MIRGEPPGREQAGFPDGSGFVPTVIDAGIPFPSPVTTNQVRIVVAAAQNSFTRIAEVTP